MKFLLKNYDGTVIDEIITNHSISLDDALELCGLTVSDYPEGYLINENGNLMEDVCYDDLELELDEEEPKMKNYYYWLDFNEAAGKAILYRMEYDADGHKDPETEEPVYSKYMEDIEGFLDAEAEDVDRAYEILDADIEKELGFLPEYEVG